MKCKDCVFYGQADEFGMCHKSRIPELKRYDDWCDDGIPKDACCDNCRYSFEDFDGNLECRFAAPATSQGECIYTLPRNKCGQYKPKFEE